MDKRLVNYSEFMNSFIHLFISAMISYEFSIFVVIVNNEDLVILYCIHYYYLAAVLYVF